MKQLIQLIGRWGPAALPNRRSLSGLLEILPCVPKGRLAELKLAGFQARTKTREAAAMHRIVGLGSTRLQEAMMAAATTHGFQLKLLGSKACRLGCFGLVKLVLRREVPSDRPAAAAAVLLRSAWKNGLSFRCSRSAPSAMVKLLAVST